MVENNEKKRREEAQQQQQQQMQMQQAQLQQEAQQTQAEMELKYRMHQEEMENNLLVAQINSHAEEIRMSIENNDAVDTTALEREKLSENARQFNLNLELQKQKQKDDARLKEQQIKATLKKSNNK